MNSFVFSDLYEVISKSNKLSKCISRVDVRAFSADKKLLSFGFLKETLSALYTPLRSKKNHLPAKAIIHIHHLYNCTKQTISCARSCVAHRKRERSVSGVTKQPEVVAMTTPTKKHSQQRNGINSLADNVRRCFKWQNKCVCVHSGTASEEQLLPESDRTSFRQQLCLSPNNL